jgi:hypothetical protein
MEHMQELFGNPEGLTVQEMFKVTSRIPCTRILDYPNSGRSKTVQKMFKVMTEQQNS